MAGKAAMKRSDGASTILQGGRAKAYRPLPEEQRRAALRHGLDAYDRGEFFEAHEILEPAWMGAADVAERELLQGLIKLAAAYVHHGRRNPAGVLKNLRGSLARLEAGQEAAARLEVDLGGLLPAIRERIAVLEAGAGPAEVPPAPAVDRAGAEERASG
jgi:predicted metal-dependent hydrolase